jgi:hypothetical protein
MMNEIELKIDSFNRYNLIFGNEILSTASLEDLEAVSKLVQNITGIPFYKLEIFNLNFLRYVFLHDFPFRDRKYIIVI